MAIDELDDFDTPPKKWLDKKQYVRVDPVTGLPQLIRVEPLMEGEYLTSNVTVYIDDGTTMVLDRDAAEVFIESMNCTPLEIVAQWKHRKEN